MTASPHSPSSDSGVPEAMTPAGMTAILCLTVAGMVLFDLVSQYAIAVLPIRPGDVFWRATAAQILTTQVSPVVLVALLAVLGGRLGGAKPRWWGVALMVVGVIFGAATVMVLMDAPSALEHGDLRAPDAFRRASVRALGSGTLGAIAMLWAGLVLLRQRTE